MFKRVTESIVNQVDSEGTLVPVNNFLDHEHFRPLCLVIKKKQTIFQRSPRYKHTLCRFDELLLPAGDAKSTESLFLKGGPQKSMQFTVKKRVSDNIDGSASVCVDSTSAELKGAASLSKEWSIKLQHNRISVSELEALKSERKINMDHRFIQKLQKTQQHLYMVHETLETLEDTIYEESTGGGGSFKIQLYATLCAKGTRENKQSITIPKGCTLAFRVIPLTIVDGSWDLYHFTDRTMLVSDGLPGGKLGELKMEIKENCEILSKLSPDMSIILLKAIKAVMRDRNLFQELTQKMEAVLDETGSCELKMESPDLKDLLNTLRSSSRHLLQMTGAITYTLDALDELTEDQLLLLLESLEEKIVPQQLKLVASILVHDIEEKKGNFMVDASLLSFSQEKQQELTIAMVEMSGAKLQKDGSVVCMEDAFSAIAALYFHSRSAAACLAARLPSDSLGKGVPSARGSAAYLGGHRRLWGHHQHHPPARATSQPSGQPGLGPAPPTAWGGNGGRSRARGLAPRLSAAAESRLRMRGCTGGNRRAGSPNARAPPGNTREGPAEVPERSSEGNELPSRSALDSTGLASARPARLVVPGDSRRAPRLLQCHGRPGASRRRGDKAKVPPDVETQEEAAAAARA